MRKKYDSFTYINVNQIDIKKKQKMTITIFPSKERQ